MEFKSDNFEKLVNKEIKVVFKNDKYITGKLVDYDLADNLLLDDGKDIIIFGRNIKKVIF